MSKRKILTTIINLLKPWAILILFAFILIIGMMSIIAIEKKYELSTITFRKVSEIILDLTIVAIFFFYYKRKFPNLVVFLKFSPKYLFYGFLIQLLLFILEIVLPDVVLLKDLSSLGLNEFSLSWHTIERLITLVIIAPIFEEIIFRGILLKLFLEYYSLPSAILFNALAFTIFHLGSFPSETLNEFLFARTECFFWGILVASLTYKTKNASAACGFHIGNNFLAFLTS